MVGEHKVNEENVLVLRNLDGSCTGEAFMFLFRYHILSSRVLYSHRCDAWTTPSLYVTVGMRGPGDWGNGWWGCNASVQSLFVFSCVVVIMISVKQYWSLIVKKNLST